MACAHGLEPAPSYDSDGIHDLDMGQGYKQSPAPAYLESYHELHRTRVIRMRI